MGVKYLENYIRGSFIAYGKIVAQKPLPFIVVPVLLTLCCSIGYFFFSEDNDVASLFTPRHAGSMRELHALKQFSRVDSQPTRATSSDTDNTDRKNVDSASRSQDSIKEKSINTNISVTFEKMKRTQYFWFDLQMRHKNDQDLLKPNHWQSVLKATSLVYDNFTCTVKNKNGKMEAFRFRPDFCHPEIGCIRFDIYYQSIGRLIADNPYEKDPQIKITYPIMQAYGKLFNVGELLGGVTLNATNQWILEVRFLVVPLQFEFDYLIHSKSNVEDCMAQMAAYFLQIDNINGVALFTVHEKGFVDEVVRLEQNTFYCACVSVVLVAIFFILSTMESDYSCMTGEALYGLLTIGMAIVSGYGLLFMVGRSYNFMVCNSPFIILCVGIDNDFLLLASWRRTSKIQNAPDRLAATLAEAGPSVVITSFTDVLCFLIGVVSGTEAISSFCLFTAVTLTFRFIYQMTFYVAILVYKCPCCPRKPKSLHRKNFIETIETPPSLNSIKTCLSKINSPKMKRKIEGQNDEYVMHKFFRTWWTRFLMKRWVRIIIAIIMFAYLAISVVNTARIEVNIQPIKILPDDSPLVEVFKNAENYYWPYVSIAHVFILTPPDLRWGENRQLVSDFVQSLQSTKYYKQESRAHATALWLKDYVKYLAYFNTESSDDEEERTIAATITNNFITTKRNQSIMSSSEKPEVLVKNNPNSSMAYMAEFYTHLQDFLLTNDYSRFTGDLRFKETAKPDEEEPSVEKFQFRIFYQNVLTWKDHVDLLLHWRNASATYPQLNAVVADHTSLNPYLDQRLTLGATTVQTMGIALLCMAAVTATLMPDARGMLFITTSFFSVDVGVIGFLRLWNCDLDPGSLTGILMMIGFSVYYTARVCYNYQISPGGTDCQEKLSSTMAAVGWPVLQGGVGTMLAILPVVFAGNYIGRVFFKTVVLVVASGLLHGLFFMPVLLVSLDLQRVNKRKALRQSWPRRFNP